MSEEKKKTTVDASIRKLLPAGLERVYNPGKEFVSGFAGDEHIIKHGFSVHSAVVASRLQRKHANGTVVLPKQGVETDEEYQSLIEKVVAVADSQVTDDERAAAEADSKEKDAARAAVAKEQKDAADKRKAAREAAKK